MTSVCKAGACVFEPAPKDTPCGDMGGNFCDDVGHCVECTTAEQCGQVKPPSCTGSIFTPSIECNNGVCKLPAPVDCGAVTLCADNDGCKPCMGDGDCGVAPTMGGCFIPHCDVASGQCKKAQRPLATPCGPNATTTSTCDATGTCAPGKYVFVTKETFPSTLGAAPQRDALCKEAAMAAGLGGDAWMSWTSDALSSPFGTPPFGRFKKDDGVPYLRLDGQQVAPDWAGLVNVSTGGMLANAIALTEYKQSVTQPFEVWTGTKPNGTYSTIACGDWTLVGAVGLFGTAGIASDTTTGWTKSKDYSCGLEAHLYCFQQ